VVVRAWMSLFCLSVPLVMSCSTGGDEDPGVGPSPLIECSTEECERAPGTPNELCFDGSTAGPEELELRLEMPVALELDYGPELARERIAERV